MTEWERARHKCGALVEAQLVGEPLLAARLAVARHTLLRRLSPELGAPPQVLFVWASAVKCEQVRVAAELLDGAALLLVPFEREPDEPLTHQYLVSRAASTKALPGNLRLLRLREALVLQLGHDDETVAPTRVMEVEPPPLPFVQLVAPLWLPLEPPPVDDALCARYCATLLDFSLARRLLRPSTQTHAKWLRHARLLPRLAGLRLVAAYVRTKGGARDELLRDWAAMECALLQTECAPFLDAVRTHRAFFAALGARWQHGQWLGYGETRVSQGVYTAPALWLLEPEFAGAPLVARRGSVALSEAECRQWLVPCLYRHMLQDWAHYQLGQVGDALPLASALARLTMRRDALDALVALRIACWADDSPVLKRVRAHRAAQAVREARPRRVVLRAADSGVDMEDLFAGDWLPPCLARAAQQPAWPKYFDRLNLVAALVDSGYTDGARATRLLSRAEPTAKNRAIVTRLMQDYARKARETTRPLTMPCSVLINAVYQEGNVTRCAYEAKANGEARRRDHTTDEQAEFRRQCACALGDETLPLWSPLDFVSHRLAREAAPKAPEEPKAL